MLPATFAWLAAIWLPGGAVAQEGSAQPPDADGRPRPAPAWDNRGWLNTDTPLRLEQLRGRVVLLNFWVFTCGNCTRTIPSLVKFHDRYRSQGLTLIGIHTPEFPPYAGEHDRANVVRALVRHGITYPNAQDNDRANLGSLWHSVLAELRVDRPARSDPI